ncbi:MAG: hypothetical protein CBD76_00770 [Pelagibacteraceae bacterium TMED216]|nr:MAG: hypothetical protein CBD76_00770 [Pelagibacteraceae bacterium TMED216]|tara:strand:+ start:725 stop:3055 length:2331 start_codon:yes stop_codon:yes gene_type:complete
MRSNYIFLILLFFLLSFKNALSELNIEASNISVDKEKNEVNFKNKVTAKDSLGNVFYSESATYNKNKKTFNSSGPTEIITSQGYKVITSNIFFDNSIGKVLSKDITTIIDPSKNKIYLQSFEYDRNKSLFFSRGKIEVQDVDKNEYFFSEIYIDENKKTLIGSDIRAFLNNENLKFNKLNEPRIFANSLLLSEDKSSAQKGIFTYCKNRGKDKCPPWSIQASKIEHVASKKTVYYDNAVLKIYDIPIFYYPKLFHPDPTVDRRSGFLIPSFSDNSNIGFGVGVPYFLNLGANKDLTITPKFYFDENPVLLAEYRQANKDSFFVADFGFTDGYKNKTQTKTAGGRAHIFINYVKNILNTENKSSNLELNLQHVSNRTYFKIYDVNSSLVNKDIDQLESNLIFDYQSDDLYFKSLFGLYEKLSIDDNKKYEYLLPYLSLEKNILTNDKIGNLDFISNVRVRNYDVNKQTEFLVNDIKWTSNKWLFNNLFENQFIGVVKNTNYNARNTSNYKNEDTNNEISAVVGYYSSLPLVKKHLSKKQNHLLTPKFLLRYAPGHMRNLNKSKKLSYPDLFELDRTSEFDVIETGLSATLGFEYKLNELNNSKIGRKKMSISMAQIINESEDPDRPAPLNQRFSDIVGNASFSPNENIKFNYNFSIDENLSDVNQNDFGIDYKFGNIGFNLSYLEEKKHIGNEEYISSGIDIPMGSGQLSLSTKRNLLLNSAEYYKLSYEYINDCLKAGLVFRREFYTDNDIEPDNSLMFTISIMPFGNIESMKLKK